MLHSFVTRPYLFLGAAGCGIAAACMFYQYARPVVSRKKRKVSVATADTAICEEDVVQTLILSVSELIHATSDLDARVSALEIEADKLRIKSPQKQQSATIAENIAEQIRLRTLPRSLSQTLLDV